MKGNRSFWIIVELMALPIPGKSQACAGAVGNDARIIEGVTEIVDINDANLTSVGVFNQEMSCDQIEIDYTEAPDNGCITTTATEVVISPATIFPNPVAGILNIQSGPISAQAVLRVYHSTGQMIVEQPLIRNLDVSSYPSGTYIALIDSEESLQTLPFIKY